MLIYKSKLRIVLTIAYITTGTINIRTKSKYDKFNAVNIASTKLFDTIESITSYFNNNLNLAVTFEVE
jgi:hypothetical protein